VDNPNLIFVILAAMETIELLFDKFGGVFHEELRHFVGVYFVQGGLGFYFHFVDEEISKFVLRQFISFSFINTFHDFIRFFEIF
jgi:hypothetical protein